MNQADVARQVAVQKPEYQVQYHPVFLYQEVKRRLSEKGVNPSAKYISQFIYLMDGDYLVNGFYDVWVGNTQSNTSTLCTEEPFLHVQTKREDVRDGKQHFSLHLDYPSILAGLKDNNGQDDDSALESIQFNVPESHMFPFNRSFEKVWGFVQENDILSDDAMSRFVLNLTTVKLLSDVSMKHILEAIKYDEKQEIPVYFHQRNIPKDYRFDEMFLRTQDS